MQQYMYKNKYEIDEKDNNLISEVKKQSISQQSYSGSTMLDFKQYLNKQASITHHEIYTFYIEQKSNKNQSQWPQVSIKQNANSQCKLKLDQNSQFTYPNNHEKYSHQSNTSKFNYYKTYCISNHSTDQNIVQSQQNRISLSFKQLFHGKVKKIDFISKKEKDLGSIQYLQDKPQPLNHQNATQSNFQSMFKRLQNIASILKSNDNLVQFLKQQEQCIFKQQASKCLIEQGCLKTLRKDIKQKLLIYEIRKKLNSKQTVVKIFGYLLFNKKQMHYHDLNKQSMYLLLIKLQIKQQQIKQTKQIQFQYIVQEESQQIRVDKELIAQYQIKLGINDMHLQILDCLGLGFGLLNQLSKSYSIFTHLIGLYSNQPIVFNNFGHLYLIKRQFYTSFQYFQQSIKQNPRLAHSFSCLGYLINLNPPLFNQIEQFVKSFTQQIQNDEIKIIQNNFNISLFYNNCNKICKSAQYIENILQIKFSVGLQGNQTKLKQIKETIQIYINVCSSINNFFLDAQNQIILLIGLLNHIIDNRIQSTACFYNLAKKYFKKMLVSNYYQFFCSIYYQFIVNQPQRLLNQYLMFLIQNILKEQPQSGIKCFTNFIFKKQIILMDKSLQIKIAKNKKQKIQWIFNFCKHLQNYSSYLLNINGIDQIYVSWKSFRNYEIKIHKFPSQLIEQILKRVLQNNKQIIILKQLEKLMITYFSINPLQINELNHKQFYKQTINQIKKYEQEFIQKLSNLILTKCQQFRKHQIENEELFDSLFENVLQQITILVKQFICSVLISEHVMIYVINNFAYHLDYLKNSQSQHAKLNNILLSLNNNLHDLAKIIKSQLQPSLFQLQLSMDSDSVQQIVQNDFPSQFYGNMRQNSYQKSLIDHFSGYLEPQFKINSDQQQPYSIVSKSDRQSSQLLNHSFINSQTISSYRQTVNLNNHYNIQQYGEDGEHLLIFIQLQLQNYFQTIKMLQTIQLPNIAHFQIVQSKYKQKNILQQFSFLIQKGDKQFTSRYPKQNKSKQRSSSYLFNKLNRKQVYCLIIGIIKSISQLQSKFIFQSDIDISNFLQLCEVFVCIDFQKAYAMGCTVQNQRLFQTTTKLIQCWLQSCLDINKYQIKTANRVIFWQLFKDADEDVHYFLQTVKKRKIQDIYQIVNFQCPPIMQSHMKNSYRKQIQSILNQMQKFLIQNSKEHKFTDQTININQIKQIQKLFKIWQNDQLILISKINHLFFRENQQQVNSHINYSKINKQNRQKFKDLLPELGVKKQFVCLENYQQIKNQSLKNTLFNNLHQIYCHLSKIKFNNLITFKAPKCFQFDKTLFLVESRLDYYQINNFKDTFSQWKDKTLLKYIISFIVSLSKIIEQFQENGIWLTNLHVCKIVRYSERFKLSNLIGAFKISCFIQNDDPFNNILIQIIRTIFKSQSYKQNCIQAFGLSGIQLVIKYESLDKQCIFEIKQRTIVQSMKQIMIKSHKDQFKRLVHEVINQINLNQSHPTFLKYIQQQLKQQFHFSSLITNIINQFWDNSQNSYS